MLSNSDTPFVRELYDGFGVTPVLATRSVSAKGDRTRAAELVIRNYRSEPKVEAAE